MNLCDWVFSWFTTPKLYNSDQSIYYAYGKKYIIITKKRFPNFVFATDENNNDVTDLAHMYAGPDLLWSGWRVTPKDMGLKKLNITLLDLKVEIVKI